MTFDPSKIHVPQSVLDRGWRPETMFQRTRLEDLIKGVPTRYGELRKGWTAKAKLGLTGLGKYLQGDDPSTEKVEGPDHLYRADKTIGDRERVAVKDQEAAANSRGLASSSFRDRGVGDALGRLSREANEVLTGYADQLKVLGDQEQEELNGPQGLYAQLQGLYTGESDYLRDNPPPPPPAPAAPAEPAAPKGGDALAQQQGWLGPWKAKPNLDTTKYSIFFREGKWYAVRK